MAIPTPGQMKTEQPKNRAGSVQKPQRKVVLFPTVKVEELEPRLEFSRRRRRSAPRCYFLDPC